MGDAADAGAGDEQPARPGARPRAGRRVPGSRLGDRLLPRLQPAAAGRIADQPPTGTFEQVARSRHHLLVTFRRDGSPVPVTVWAAPADGRLYVRTERASGKVKRLQRTPRALIAPATVLGRPRGAPLAVVGRVLESHEEPSAERALAVAHGRYREWFEGNADRLGVDMCYLALVPAT
jgi:PPOX class probable F420-dependent enzyme